MIPGARLVVLGRQGAGKGTQCVRLARHYVVPHISTGDILRATVKAGTELGRQAAEFMERGDLLPDELIVGIVEERLSKDDTTSRGFVLDGFPRTLSQAQALLAILGEGGIDLAIDLFVPEKVVLHRLAGRRVCRDCGANYSVDRPPARDWTCDNCGGEVIQRKDDTEEAISRRLAIYEDQNSPLVAWFEDKGLLIPVDGVGSTDEVTSRLIEVIDSRLEQLRHGAG